MCRRFGTSHRVITRLAYWIRRCNSVLEPHTVNSCVTITRWRQPHPPFPAYTFALAVDILINGLLFRFVGLHDRWAPVRGSTISWFFGDTTVSERFLISNFSMTHLLLLHGFCPGKIVWTNTLPFGSGEQGFNPEATANVTMRLKFEAWCS